MAALPPVEPLRALYSNYSQDYAGELIIAALETWVAGEMALSATRFEQARDSFDQTDSPQEWAILDEWVNAAADLFLEQAEAALAAGEQPSYKAVGGKYDEAKHKRDESGRWATTNTNDGPESKNPSQPSQPSQPTGPAKPEAAGRDSATKRPLPASVQKLQDKYYAGSDAKRLGWSPDEFHQIVDGIEKTILAQGKLTIACTAQEALDWAERGKITGSQAKFGLTADGLVNLVLDTKTLAECQFEMDGEKLPGQWAARVQAAKYAGTMSHLYAPVMADTYKGGYLPFWACRNVAIVMGDRVKAEGLKLTGEVQPTAVRGILVLGKIGKAARQLSEAYSVGMVQGDSSDDLMDADLAALTEQVKEKAAQAKANGLKDKVKKAITLSTYATTASERVRRAWVTRHARAGYVDAKYRLKAAQRAAGGVPARYTTGRFNQLATQMRAAAAQARQAARAERRAEHQAQMSGGRTLKELVEAGVSAQTHKRMGPGPHPDGTPQSVHAGGHGKQIDAAHQLAAPAAKLKEYGFNVDLPENLATPGSKTEEAVQETLRDVELVKQYLPKLLEAVKGAGVTIAFTNILEKGKAEYDNTSKVISIRDGNGESFVHELAHWYDAHLTGVDGDPSKGSHSYASYQPGPVANLVAKGLHYGQAHWLDAYSQVPELAEHLKYLQEPTEVFARLVDQYIYQSNQQHRESVDANFPHLHGNRYYLNVVNAYVPEESFESDVRFSIRNMFRVDDDLDKHMGPGPHPDGTPQSVHSGEWKLGIGGILREKVRERVEQVKLKSGELKDKTVIDFAWKYADTGQEVTPEDREYLTKLGIGPAYTNVRVNPDFATDGLVAEYDDVKGRSVRLYSKAHSQQAAQEKFERLKAFNAAMPAMQAQIRADLDSPNAKVKRAARVLFLVEKTAFRIGSDRDTGADKQAYGASTLLAKHVKVNGSKVKFSFVGKKGVNIRQSYDDPELAKLMTEQLAGKDKDARLFEADDNAVREYLDTLPGAKDFLVKDFRTWNATRWALEELDGVKPFTDEKAFTKFQKGVAEKVSARLGNTPVMALGSYIDPHVWDTVRQPQWGAWVPKKLQ